MKLEFLALKWAVIETFQEYLLGHKWVMDTMLADKLDVCDLEIKYCSGCSSQNIDILLRQLETGPHLTLPLCLAFWSPAAFKRIHTWVR